jgi:putative membrane protein
MNLSKLCCVTLVALGLAASNGCSKGSSASDAPGASQGSEATPGETDNGKPTDGQIAQVLANVDDAEVQQAQLALTKTSNPQVRDFANMMIEQHTSSKQQAAQLATQANINPSPSPIANKLQTKASKTLEKLNAADPSDFDNTYVKAQIEQHKDVLDLLNDKLIPAATDPMMQQQLTTTKAMVQHHIDAAEQIKI